MYQVLYRKYRPQVFSDVVGQEHITATLTNELSANRLSHAYLFTGSRGTGKTTCAKILSKAVNCENPVEGNPCNVCDVCKGIDNGSIFDVLEIDAASNTGVDNIRNLKEEANFTPTVGKYRVYIIDEVHMLSIGAFNALLKTLEEPPEHVIFILATTEVHKLPATILSRCQRFDFKRIGSEPMANRLNYVAQQENLTLTQDGAMLIARIADGGLRDALSILDQCAGRGETIDEKLVSDVAGIAGREYLYELSNAIGAKNSAMALDTLNTLHNNSCDMERLCTELINHFRNFLIVKTVKSSRELIVCPDEEYENIRENSSKFQLETVIYILDLFQRTLESIKSGCNRRIEMEMTFIKLCEPALESTSSAILSRLSALENAVKSGITVSVPTTQPEIKRENMAPPPEPHKVIATSEPQKVEVSKEALQMPPVEQPSVKPTVTLPTNTVGDTLFTGWGEVLKIITQINIPLFGILNNSKAYIRGNDILLIDSPNASVKGFISTQQNSQDIKNAIKQVTGVSMRLGIYKKAENENSVKKDPLENFIQNAQHNGINVKFE